MAYGQRDPLVEYKRESYKLFEGLMARIEEDTLRFLFLMQPVEEHEKAEQVESLMRRRRRQEAVLAPQTNVGGGTATRVKSTPMVGRNDPCPCGQRKEV
jgi:preprotein translocase subunit SecA